MGMGQELKDFVSGFSSGYKLMTPTEGELKRQDEKDRQAAIDKLAGSDTSAVPGRVGTAPHLYKSGDDTPDGAKAVQGRSPSFVMAENDPTLKSYLDTTIGVESNGKANAKNPNSTATGLGQFTERTWADMMRKHPELGLTPDGRTNPDQSKRALVAFTKENAAGLKSAGFDPNPGNLYVSHFLGVNGAKKMLSGLNTDPNAPAAAYADPAAVAANKTVFFNPDGTPKTAASFYKERTSKFQKRADAGLDLGDDTSQPTQMAADGGAIMPVMQMPAEEDAAAAPPLPPRRPSDADLQVDPRTNSESEYHRIAGTHEAIDAGMGRMSRDLESPDAALPQAGSDYHGRVAAFHRGDESATPQDIRQIDQTIDPDNRLQADAKAVARLNAGYKYFMMQGDPDRAEKYAKAILGYTKHAVHYYGVQAEQKLRAGDVAGAASDIQKGHNEVPNGASLYIDKVDPKTGAVDYRVMDEDGDLNERGQAYANQLMHIATGMQNGSEWLNQIAQGRQNSLTAAQKAAEKRRTADEGAANSFYGGSEMDLVNKMSPEARKGFDAASPALKRQMLADLANRENAARAQTKDDNRQAYYQRRQDLQDTKAQDQQDYAGHAAAIENARDALNAQRADDPNDTEKMGAAQAAYDKALGDARAWAGAGPNRAAFVPQLERLGKAGGGVGGAGGGGSGGKGGTKDERNIAGLDRQYTMFEKAAQREKDPERQKQLVAALPHQKAQIEFTKHDTGFDDKITPDVETHAARIVGVKEGAEPDDKQATQLNEYQNAIRGILQGDNDLTPKQAADLAKLAVKTGKINLDNGMYSINGSDPIRMSPRAVSSLARLVKMNKPAEQPKNTTTTRNPFNPDKPSTIPTPDEEDTANSRAQRVQARQDDGDGGSRRRRDKSAEYDQLRSQIDDSTFDRMKKLSSSTDGRVPLAYLRRVVREQAGKRARVVDPDPNMP